MSTQLGHEITGTSLVRPHTKKKWLLPIAVVGLLVVVMAAYPKITEEIAYPRGIEAYAYGATLRIYNPKPEALDPAHKYPPLQRVD